jgi:hypothetical protein
VPLDDWMPTLKSKLAEISGLNVRAYDELPAKLVDFPTLLILPHSGRFEYSAGGPLTAHHEVQLNLYVAEQILGEGFATAVPYIELVRNKLAANMSLAGTVVTILPSAEAATYDGPAGINYAGSQHLGIIFRYHVKENEGGAYTVAA